MAKKWTKEEEQYLLKNAESMSRAELAEHFGVSTKSVGDKIRRLSKNASKKDTKSKKDESQTPADTPDTSSDPLDAFGSPRKEFIRDYIRVLDYRDIAEVLGIDAAELKKAVEKTGIKLPIERARKWESLNFGTYHSQRECARCQVQVNHCSFLVGIEDCRKCIEKNIKHWIQSEEDITLNFREFQ